MTMRNALLRGEALTTLAAAGILALAPALDPAATARRLAFYSMSGGLAAIALVIVAIDIALRSRPAFSEAILRELANPWEPPAEMPAGRARIKNTADRPGTFTRSSDPAPAPMGGSR
jgi:hypothetical protein